MELRQTRPFGTEGRKTMHNFLSLYSPVEEDPRPPQGGYLKTQDFLQPLEQARKTIRKEETKVEVAAVEKPPSAEHTLPGGIGTYSISYLHQRVPKPETSLFVVEPANSTDRNDDNSNCSSYTESGFTLWDESAIKKGKTGKENLAGDRHVVREAGVSIGGQPTTSLEWQSQSSSNHKHNTATLSSLSSAQQSSALKNQSFLHMLTSAKNAQEEDEDEEEEEFVVKKEQPLHTRGSNLSVKVDEKRSEQKPNTPRSKHSATEQRRRSKINDRFQMLREVIPHSDQKRDKASFLLEVIEYIHFLQEKVHKYEGSYQAWENEPSKLPWKKCPRTTQGFIDHSQGTTSASGPALIYAGFDENKIGISTISPVNGETLEPKISTSSVKEISQQPELTKKAARLPMRPDSFPFCGTSSIASLQSSRLPSDADILESKSQSQFRLSGSHLTDYAAMNDKLKGQELSLESGTINISSVYSQRLLNTLTLALQNSGVDLSQANLSVQIDLGKRANGRLNSSASTVKGEGEDVFASNQPRSREESDHASKRLKTS